MSVVALHLSSPVSHIQSVAEVFYRLTPEIMVRGNQTLFLEIAKCQALYSETQFLKYTKAILQRLKLSARISLAADPATAFSQCYFGVSGQQHLPIDALKFYLDLFNTENENASAIEHMIMCLKSLGLTTLQDFRKFPHGSITSRFGSLGLMAHLRVRGEAAIVGQRFVPTEIVTEKHEFDLESPVENLEPIYFVLKNILDMVILRLRGRGKRLRQFQLILRQEDFAPEKDRDYITEVVLQLPYLSQKSILQITKEKMEAQVRARPFQFRVAAVILTVLEEAPYFMTQKNLFDQKAEENQESFYQLVSRLATKLGKGKAFFAQTKESFLPEKNWRRISEYSGTRAESHRETHPWSDRLPQRPLRLLPTPLPIEIRDHQIFLPQKTERIAELADREVVFSDWWEEPLERIYFQLTTFSLSRLDSVNSRQITP